MTAEISKDLEKTREVLHTVLKRVSELSKTLEPLERDLRAEDFAKSGIYILGTSAGVVCFPTGLSPGDPMKAGIEKAKEKGIRMPTLIESDDPEESWSTCDSILRMLKLELFDDRKVILKPGFIVIIRWDNLLPHLDGKKMAVIGKRYITAPEESLKRFIGRLEKIGLRVIEDSGQYGGGLLAYEFIQTFGKNEQLLILQLTLSLRAAEDVGLILKILELLSSFQVHSHDRYRS